MPYKTKDALPEAVKRALRDVPHAQDIYKEVYNSAWKQYKDPDERRNDHNREETAHATAWSAVKQKYQKGQDGKWHPKT